ncbi:MAG: hypothetical protein IPO07_30650 [Haliscomenobacter sp.]|nr:hypothetical protein [Haliscomenobacter sp.]MBK9492650.1 hypothetical protein [Haliscomenobacter sp.]
MSRQEPSGAKPTEDLHFSVIAYRNNGTKISAYPFNLGMEKPQQIDLLVTSR